MSNTALPSAEEIFNLHTQQTTLWHNSSMVAAGEGLLALVSENHLRNFSLWHEEDIARRDDLPAERIKESKRAIDRYNQQRNNFIEEMDKFIIPALSPQETNCPQHSETPGMIIDRLSILALKEYHMREQTQRSDAGDEHRQKCHEKLTVIVEQRKDLARCLQILMGEVRAGKRRIKVYYQFKMYNDPSLNPELYRGTQPTP